jgi:transposase
MNSLDDLVGPDHPVRIIDKIVDSIIKSDIERFEKTTESEVGRPRYHQSVLLKLYLYGYFNGISSSRKLEVETRRNKELIWLLGSLSPDHWTISNYRKENGENIKYVTKKFREFLKENGYIKLKTVAIDGSKIKANTNREMLTKEKIEKKLEGIDKKIEEYLKRISETDINDDLVDEIDNNETEGEDNRYIEKIIELQKRVEQLEKQKAILEKENRKYISGADVEARLMKSREGKLAGYNVQIAVDAEHKMIVDSEVEIDQTDYKMLPSMIESIKEEVSEVPKEVIADNGYNSADLIESIEKEEEIEIYVSQQQKPKDKEVIKFRYDKEKDEYKCSKGKRLVLVQKKKRKNSSFINVYRGKECEGCPVRSQCTSSKKGRLVHRYINQEWRDQYREKMESKTGKRKTHLRKSIVEHPFGTIKYLMGKIPLKLRGREKVSTEINLYTTVYNLKRLFNLESFIDITEKVDSYSWKTD